MDPQDGSANYRSILVTGASGFVGQHLLPALAQRWPQAALHATAQSRVPQGTTGVWRWHRMHIADSGQVAALVRALHPDVIIHLAAQSHIPTSFQDPDYTWRVNLSGTFNILESIRKYSPVTRLINVGSADMYGATFRAGVPVTEGMEFQPLNPYAASKAAADLAAYQYAQSEGLRIIRARPFNHTGPGQDERFVLASFASQIARIESGKSSPIIETGNLDAERDFLDVSDVVRAYLALLTLPDEYCRGQAYNIASGRPVAVRELLQRLLALSSEDITTRRDPARQRPTDISCVTADITAFQADTGWKPAVTLNGMLQRLLNDCRQRVLSDCRQRKARQVS